MTFSKDNINYLQGHRVGEATPPAPGPGAYHEGSDFMSPNDDAIVIRATQPFSARTLDEWPEIDTSLLEDNRPTLPLVPLDVLPSPWRDWVGDAACNAGAPPDYVVQALLAAVSGLAGRGVQARVNPSWSEPLVLWQALVGASSTGKTPALDTVGRPLAAVEKLLRREVGHGAARPEQGKGAVVGRDAALAGLVRAVAARPPGVLLWRDDATPWLQALVRDAKDDNAGARWIDAWTGRGELAVSIIGSLHPDQLADQLSGSPDGVPARFLFTWPSAPLHRPFGDDKPLHEEQATTLLHRISSVVGGVDQPLVLGFDEEALKLFERSLGRVGEEARAADGPEAAWLGKGRGTIVRLAGILALLDWSRLPATVPLPRVIKRDHVGAAVRLWQDYFRPHARAVLDRGVPSDFEREARRIVRWLKAGAKSEVTRTDVRVQALGRTVNSGRTEYLLGHLQAKGVVRPAASGPQVGRPLQLWEVNPSLAGA